MIKRQIKTMIMPLIVTIISIFIFVEYVKAGTEVDLTPSSNTNTQDKGQKTYTDVPAGGSKKKYRCQYTAYIGGGYNLNISSVNMNGEEINDSNGIPQISTLSGTWVGVNVTEKVTSSWRTDSYEYFEIRKKYVCTYNTGVCEKYKQEQKTTSRPSTKAACPSTCDYIPPASPQQQSNTGESYIVQPLVKIPNTGDGTGAGGGGKKKVTLGTCKCKALVDTKECEKYKTEDIEEETDYFENYECPDSPSGHSSYKLTNSEQSEKLESIAKPSECDDAIFNKVSGNALRSIQGINNTVQYIEDNDYESFVKNNYRLKSIVIDDPSKNISGGGSYQAGAYTGTYYYRPKNICINVKTGLVYYDEKCTGNVKSIEDVTFNGKKYWHYFVPLNAKTGNTFYFDVIQKNGMLNAAFCYDALKKYPNYTTYIRPVSSSKTYMKDYAQKGTNSYDYKLITKEGGCRTHIRLEFDLAQKFYNESGKVNAYSLNGYKFYFRQVDINKPFNTIPNASSSWYEWYNKNSKNGTANFNKSFNTITYMADVLKPDKIRKYNSNSDNFYTSWQKMREDGTSEFITKNDFVTRKNPGSTYKLGCGPGNTDWSGCK